MQPFKALLTSLLFNVDQMFIVLAILCLAHSLALSLFLSLSRLIFDCKISFFFALCSGNLKKHKHLHFEGIVGDAIALLTLV